MDSVDENFNQSGIPEMIEEFIGRVNSGTREVASRGYGSPLEGGAEYLAMCVPAFSSETVHRDEK